MRTLLALLVSTTIAFAEAKKVDFGTPLLDLDGKPMSWDCKVLSEDKKDCLEWRETTLRVVAVTALTKIWPGETISEVDQIQRTLLAQDIVKYGEVALSSKDTDLLCKEIAKLVNKASMNALVTLRAYELLDPVRLKR